MNLNNLKIRTKLLLSFGALIFLIGAFGFFALRTMGSIHQKTVEIETNWMPSVHVLGEISELVTLRRLWIVRFAYATDAEKRKLLEDKYRSGGQKTEKYKEEYASLITSDEERRAYESFEEKQSHLAKAFYEERLFPAVRAGNQAEAVQVIEESVQPFVELGESLDNLIAVNFKGAREAGEAAERLFARAQKITITIILFGVFLAIVITFLLTRAITSSLGYLVGVSAKVAKGDLTQEIEIKSNDEIGQLTKAFRTMVDGLREVVRQVLTTAERVSSSSQQLSSSSEEMNATTQEISSTVQQIAKGAENTARQVEETSKTMEQMNASVGQVATGAQQAASASVQANQIAQRGSESSKEAVTKMSRIYQSVTNSAGTVKKLGERSVQISEIVNVITDIADQTNLLALNAAIEAARAGEAGRGFAVVAEEVRKLAEGSAKAAEQIAQLIREIQKETTDAVSAMDTGSKEVGEGREAVTKAGESFQEIAKAVENTASMVEQISAATEQMAAGTKQVVKSVDDIASTSEEAASATEEASASTEEMTAAMEEMTTSAQELADMAIELRKLVGKFKISEGEFATPFGKEKEFTSSEARPHLASLKATKQIFTKPLRFQDRREPLRPITEPKKGPNGSRAKAFRGEGKDYPNAPEEKGGKQDNG